MAPDPAALRISGCVPLRAWRGYMNRRNFFSMLLAVPALALLTGTAAAATGPVLLVVAHPDDEY